MNGLSIAEINRDTFWTLIDQAREQCGQDLDASAQWLKNCLLTMEPQQSQNFHDIMHAYMDAANKYGLWTAGEIMCEYGCTDDGFMDFRAWVIAQGKEVYLAALNDPDSLADVPAYGGCQFESLLYIGDIAYEELTGRSAYDDIDKAAYKKLKAEIRQSITYGDGIGYPYSGADIPAYLPRLCRKNFTEAEILFNFSRRQIWNPTSPEIKRARKSEKKSKKVQQRKGDAR